MKILLINAINPYAGVEGRYPPLGLGYLAASLIRFFGKDAFEFKIVDKNVERILDEFVPDIVGITSVTQNYNLAKKYAGIAKNRRIPVIIGGIHISTLPKSLSRDMDIGVIGEAENTIVDLIKLYFKENCFKEEGLKDIPGILFWNKGELTFTNKRELIANLDDIPFPARELLNIDKNTYIFSSRGCPYRCVFCASSRYWDKVRYFSAEYVVAEIDELVNKYQAKVINFYDDLMMANKERLKKIVALLKLKPYYSQVKFTANARANVLNKEVVCLLKEMNVFSVGMGLESGCRRILQYLKGDSVKVEDGMKAIKLLKKSKISPNASFVIGSPDETEEEIMETLAFIKKSGLEIADTYILTPFPGTPVWEHSQSRGLVSDDMDWDRLNVSFQDNYDRAVIVSRTISRQKLYWLFRKFQRLNAWLVLQKALRHPSLWIRGVARVKNVLKEKFS